MKLAPVLEPKFSLSTQMPTFYRGWSFIAVLVSSAIFWMLAWYGETVQSMVATWLHSETFAHGLLIVPISAWLVWRRRYAIRALNPRPNFWMLLPLVLVGFAGLLGHLASVMVVQQYCLVLMILLLAATILGNQVVRELAFPLLFLLLAVPFGEVLLPVLMEHTADFVVFSLRLTGIPVHREGLYFTVPSGNWSVVEACSGLRYLIASLTLGFLYAYLTYRSLARRVVFVMLSVVVPIVANWLRAYIIVMIGHLSSMKHAVGVDHLIYGWLFFGVVMLILFWLGSFWREDHVSLEAMPDSVLSVPISQSALMAIVAATIASAGAVSVWPALALHLHESRARTQPALQAPSPAGGWQPAPGHLTDWTPRFLNPSARISQVYIQGERRVELYMGYYHNQRQGREMISSLNTLVRSNDKVWGSLGESHRVLMFNDNEVSAIETKLKRQSTHLLVWHWYWIDGQYTSNPYWAKLLQAKSQLLGRGDDGAVIIVSTEFDLNTGEAVDRLQDFVKVMSPGIATSLQNAR